MANAKDDIRPAANAPTWQRKLAGMSPMDEVAATSASTNISSVLEMDTSELITQIEQSLHGRPTSEIDRTSSKHRSG